MNVTIINRRTIYALRKTYGSRITLTQFGSQTVDTQTGRVSTSSTNHTIHAIVLPSLSALPQLSMPQFAYGGNFKMGDRQLLLLDSDVPVTPDMQTTFTIKNEKWNVIQMEAGEGYWWLQIRRVELET